jgi:hypothetical protein
VSALVVDLPVALVKSLPDILVSAFKTSLIGIPKAIGQAILEALGLGGRDGRAMTEAERQEAARLRRLDPRGQTGVENLFATYDAEMAAVAGRDRATGSRSASTARRASSQRSVPASTGRNPFEGLAAAWDAQYAGPMGLSPTTPQLRG